MKRSVIALLLFMVSAPSARAVYPSSASLQEECGPLPLSREEIAVKLRENHRKLDALLKEIRQDEESLAKLTSKNM